MKEEHQFYNIIMLLEEDEKQDVVTPYCGGCWPGLGSWGLEWAAGMRHDLKRRSEQGMRDRVVELTSIIAWHYGRLC